MNIVEVDVLVVGLGPAGASALRVMAAAGLKVLGIDKRKTIGEPIQCAEYIPAPIGSYAVKANSLVQQVKNMESYLLEHSAGSNLYDNVNPQVTNVPGIIIDRRQFDQGLVRSAEQVGAQTKTRCCLQEIDESSQLATVVQGNIKSAIRYQYLIAADGPKSTIAKLVKAPSLRTIKAQQITVPLRESLCSTKIWLSNRYPGGYAWLFPRGDNANIGVGFSTDDVSTIKKALHQLHEELVTSGIVYKKISYQTGGNIPVSGMREKLHRRQTLFVGDAAGLTHPITGAGIAPAVYSGEVAGQTLVKTIKENRPNILHEYRDSMRECYGEGIRRALKKRQIVEDRLQSDGQNYGLTNKILRSSWVAYPEYYHSI